MKIIDVSKKFNIPLDTLRYYERIGVLPTVKRDEKQRRNYTAKDCKALKFIQTMVKAQVPLESLIDYMHLFCAGDTTKKARKAIIQEETGKLKKRIKAIETAVEKLEK